MIVGIGRFGPKTLGRSDRSEFPPRFHLMMTLQHRAPFAMMNATSIVPITTRNRACRFIAALFCYAATACRTCRGRQGQGLAARQIQRLRQGGVQARRRHQRRDAAAGSASSAASPTSGPRLSGTSSRTQGNLYRRDRRRRQALQGDAGRKVQRRSTPAAPTARCCVWLRTPTAPSTPAPGRPGRSSASAPTAKARSSRRDLDSYVWSLAYDPASKSICSPAPDPRARSTSHSGGRAAFFTRPRQDHILCPDERRQSTLYAGTDKGGLVYRIDATDKGFVLYQAHQAEVRSLLVPAMPSTRAPVRPSRPQRQLGGGKSSGTVRPPATTRSTASPTTAPCGNSFATRP